MDAKRSVSDLKDADLKGKGVFVRVDFNVPLDENLNITDDTKLRAAVRTIKYLMERDCKVILCSHLGRPVGVTPRYSLRPLVSRLSQLLGVEVNMANDCAGGEVQNMVAAIPDGGVLLLENVRFHHEEKQNNSEFARQLASLADVFVNDAFGTAHRAHASTEGMAKYLKPAVAGLLMKKELDCLVGPLSNPKKPIAAIVGGAELSTEFEVLNSLLNKVDILIVGGAMIFSFYKAKGYPTGSFSVEQDQVRAAAVLMEKAEDKGVNLMLPTDLVIVNKFAIVPNIKVVPASAIPCGWMGVDVGPDSIKTFNDVLLTANTIFWSGLMGVDGFERLELGTKGTEAIAKNLAKRGSDGVFTIVGGGDSIAVVNELGLADRMGHITTGSGACIELLVQKTLPGVAVLDAKNKGSMGRKAKKLAKSLLKKGKGLLVTASVSGGVALVKELIKED